MSHAYPLALDARTALGSEDDGARTRAEAQHLLDGRRLIGLKSDWLTLTPTEADGERRAIERGVDQGFVQRYEDASGNIVLAITFWEVSDGAETVDDEPAPEPPKAKSKTEDHTDDLYFRSGRTKRRGRKRYVDPNQLDLFGERKADEDAQKEATADE